MTLRRSLLAGLVLVVLIPALAALWVLADVESRLEASVGRHAVSLAAGLGNKIDRYLFHRIESLRDFAQTSPQISARLAASNRSFAALGPDASIRAEIDRRDREWIATPAGETTPLIAEVLGDSVSSLLLGKQEHYRRLYGVEVFGELFVTDRHGATVAETDRTSDYRQDDEGWWQTALREGVAVGDPVFDESAGLDALEISLRIDGADGAPAGVLKAVLNIAEVDRVLSDFVAESSYRSVAVELLDAEGQVLLRRSKGDLPRVPGQAAPAATVPVDLTGFGRVEAAGGRPLLRATAPSPGFRDFDGKGWSVLLDLDRAEALASAAELRRGMLVVGAGGLALAFLVALLISTALGRQLALAVEAADRLAAGKLDFDGGRAGISEVASLLESMERMVGNVRHAVRAMVGSARQGRATARSLVALSREISGSARSLAETSEETSASMEEMAASIEQVAGHAAGVAAAVEDSSASVEEMAASIRSVASSSEELSGSVGQTLSALEQIVASLRKIADRGSRARLEADDVVARTTAGRAAVHEAVAAVEEISASMAEIVGSIDRLGGGSRKINQIADVLEDISARTHLLAVNAAVQAAHAGEHGKGFTVVAREISSLAQQSSDATQQIVGVLSLLQQDVQAAAEVTRTGSQAAGRGVELTGKAGADLDRIRDTTGAFISTVDGVGRALELQATAAEQVVATFEHMRSLTEQVLRANRDQAAGSERILTAFHLINSMASDVSQAMREQSRGSEEIVFAMRRLAEASAAGNRAAAAIVEIGEEVRTHAAEIHQASEFFSGDRAEGD